VNKILELLWNEFALKQVINFFEDDSHNIISKKGWIKLNNHEYEK